MILQQEVSGISDSFYVELVEHTRMVQLEVGGVKDAPPFMIVREEREGVIKKDGEEGAKSVIRSLQLPHRIERSPYP